MRLIRLLVVLACTPVLLWRTLHAETLRVPATFPSIQQAIDASSSGDEILVAPGAYPETLNTRAKRLTLRSEAGAVATIIDGGQRGTVLTFNGGGLVEGFTFTGGLARYNGGGILVQGELSTVIRNNVLQGNRAGFEWETGWGGGIAGGLVAHLLVERNVIRENSAGASGGGMAITCLSDCVVRDNVVDSNDALWAGGASVDVTEFANNVISNNVAHYRPGGIEAIGVGRVHGNTVVSNENASFMAEAVAGILAVGEIVLSNNLVAHNRARQGNEIGILCYLCRLECNDSWGHRAADFEVIESDTTGMRNFSADPLFCGLPSGDLTIGHGSPCAPKHSRGCGLIGAQDVACGVTSSARATWGKLKVRYR